VEAPAPEESREEPEEGADRGSVERGRQDQARFLFTAVEGLPGVPLVRGVLQLYRPVEYGLREEIGEESGEQAGEQACG
jgi:hypothetical protein